MSEEVEVSGRTAAAIAASAERFIGYLYSGFLLVVIALLERDNLAKLGFSTGNPVSVTGGFLAAIIIFVLGIGVYSVYFRVLGEFVIYPIQHILHHLFFDLGRKAPTARSSPVGLMVGYGVSKWHARAAYMRVRDEFFTKKHQIEIQVAHGELHVLYITATVSLCAFFILKSRGLLPSVIYLIVSGLFFVFALMGDTRQHTTEAVYIRKKEAKIKEFLQEEGFISLLPKKASTKKNPALQAAGIVFMLVAVMHILRFVFKVGVVVSGFTIPLWYSLVGFIIAFLLSLWMFRSDWITGPSPEVQS